MRIIIHLILFLFFVLLFTILGGNFLQIENIKFTPGETVEWLFLLKILLIFFIIGMASTFLASLTGKRKPKIDKRESKKNEPEQPVVTVEEPEETRESLIDIIKDNNEKVEKIPEEEKSPKNQASGVKSKTRKKK